MKYFILFIVFSLISLCKGYVQITDENFEELVTEKDEWVLDFYADWCGFCKRVEPKFQAADRFIRVSQYSHVKLGVVDVEKNPGLSARFFISQLPTILHVREHEVRDVPHVRSEEDIIKFIINEQWRLVSPKSNIFSPFGLFGKFVGFTGRLVKKLSNYSAWTMIGFLSSLLLGALSLTIFSSRKNLDQVIEEKVEKKDKDE